MTKTAFYAQMAEEAAKNITGSYERWTAFLTTASRLYKYPYPEQLMIFTQRPDATACAEYDLWNDTMHRYIKRGSKGIALIDMTGEKPRLRYVFDVSDTGTRKNSRPVQLWTMLPEHEQPIAEAIDKAFGVSENLGPVENHIFEAARRLAGTYWEEHHQDISDIVADSYLNGYDEFNVGVSFRRAAANSIAYSVFSRTFGNANDFFSHEDFLDVFDFNTQAASNVLGTAVSEISSQIFREIERTIRTYERSKQAERSQNYDRTHLHTERGLSDPGHSDGDAGNEAPGQVRQDAPGVPAGEPDTFVQPPSSDREAVSAPVGDSGDSSRTDGADDGRAFGGEPGTGQENESDGLGTAHEQPESTGGGGRTDGAGLQLSEQPEGQPVQLSFMDLFPTELEQINHIDEAERMEQMPSAFSFAQNEIDGVLRFGSNTSFSREHIVDAFQKGKSPKEIALLLQREFHGGFGIKGERGDYAAWYAEDGIHLHRGHEAQFASGSQVILWEAAAERIGTLLEEGSFATNIEVAEASDRVRSELALRLLYLKHDFSDEGRELGLLPSMDDLPLGYPDATATLADRLKEADFAGNLQREFADFLTAYAEDRDILRFHYHRMNTLSQGLQELTLERREYPEGLQELSPPQGFITEDEINASLAGGSSVEGGKGRIYRHFTEDHTTKEKADFLKNEYGIGGRSHAVSGSDYSSEDHSAKGIMLQKADCPDVVLSWIKAAKRIDSLIRKDRYLTPEQKTQLETRTTVETEMQEHDRVLAQEQDYAPRERFIMTMTSDAFPDPEDAFAIWDNLNGEYYGYSDGTVLTFATYEAAEEKLRELRTEEQAQKTEATALEPEKPARPTAIRMSDALLVGDTVYLDGQPFTVERVGMFNVEFRDPSLFYPVSRSESKERLERLLSLDERNLWLMDSVVSLEAPEEQEHTELQQEPSQADVQSVNAAAQLTTDDFSDFERVAAEYLPHLHERSYEFDCTVKGEKNRLRYEVTVGDDGESFNIHSEHDDIWNRMSTQELEKLSGILEAEALYFDLRDDIRAASTTAELKDVEFSIMESQSPYFPSVSSRVWEEFNRRMAKLIPEVNYRIMDDHLGEGGPKEKFWRNTKAIAVLKQIEEENRPATLEEQHILSQYVGWGGIADAFDPNKSAWAAEYSELKGLLTAEEYTAARASTLNAHFTNPTVIKAIYEAVGNMGFESGNILEPSMGVGNFFGLLPETMQGSRLYGVELDSITGRIAQKLYPKADIKLAGFETTDRRDFYDLAVGNVPFGNYRVSDKPYDKLGFSIHNYFFAKALDQVRPGGVVAFVTSRYTMDAKNPDARKYMAQRAELLGAIRLPNNAFRANAGTDVVSDILFLQKRDHPIDVEPDWVHLGLTPEGFAINSYFVDHPEMLLGKLTTESTQYGREESTVIPIEGAVLSDQLHEAIQHICGRYEALELVPEGNLTLQGETIPADPNVKNFSYTVVDGEVYFRENSIMRKAELNAAAEGRIKGMVELRGLVQELIDYQLLDYPDEAIVTKQQELNTAYDRFTNTYGILNSRANAQAFSEDSSYYLLCSLENVDENGNLESKADMFTKRTIRPERAVTSVDTPAEALAVSIGERGKVELPYMAELLGTPGDFGMIRQELHGVIFHDPMQRGNAEDGWQTADEYLSGNVRKKLRVAELAVGTDPEYAVNVEYLKKAQPRNLDASEIDVRLGATWVDRDYIQQFMEETFEPPFYIRRNIEVKFSQRTAEWQITGKSLLSHNDVHACMTYGTSRANAYRILEDTLNLRDIRIYDTVKEIGGRPKRVLNKKETTLAQQKQQAIKDAFQSWIWKDPTRREVLVTKYNELFNSTRPREYNGSHIRFGGMNPEIRLREHQQNAIAHVLYGGNTLLAHEVGAGKTFEMAASAMEAKRLGLCRKSLFVVPNHLTLQWANEFLRLYPSAKLLVASKKDFETARRKKFCARIATGDYDAVIIGHSQFEKIPVSVERQERMLTAQIEEIEDALAEIKHQQGERFSIKQMEKTRKSLEIKMQKLKAIDRKDDVITFEQLGVDRLFVDEAHAFKNLFLYTKMRNVAGLSTSEAQKSSDMFMKCQYMDEITGGRGIIFATGTPVSNSMTELYTMMRYLQYGTLQQKGLTHFDSWASTFGETTTAIELAPEGTGYRARTRFAKFFNLPELMNLFKEVADIKTSDQLHLPVPEAKFETVVVQPSEHQQAMVADLSERAARVHAGNVDPSVDNMLKITSDGRKLGLDQRLMNPLLPDDPDSKLNACVRNVLKIYEEGMDGKLTQLLFCDLSTPKNDGSFNVYDDIKAKLVAAGVPETEVAFIHDADTEAKKKELFAKVRAGQVRVLLGSTQKMGAGTNVQDRLVAVHHLDVGWRPADMTQRNGRIIRQGNHNKQVQVYQYVTEGTFDAYLYQTLENKQKFISQIMTSKSPVRSCDDVDEQALSYAEIKALCAGDPQIKEKMDLDVEVARLKVLKADHQSQQYRLEDQLLKYFPAEIERTQGVIRGFQADLQTVASHPQPKEGFCGMEIGDRHYEEKADAGEAILDACQNYLGKVPADFGSYRGFQMELSFDSFIKEFQIALKGEMTHRVFIGTSAGGNLLRLDNALAGIETRLEESKQQLENLFRQREAAQAELGKPFPQEAELAEKSARLAELDAILNMNDRGRTKTESSRENEEKPSVLADLRDRADRILPADCHNDEEVTL